MSAIPADTLSPRAHLTGLLNSLDYLNGTIKDAISQEITFNHGLNPQISQLVKNLVNPALWLQELVSVGTNTAARASTQIAHRTHRAAFIAVHRWPLFLIIIPRSDISNIEPGKIMNLQMVRNQEIKNKPAINSDTQR